MKSLKFGLIRFVGILEVKQKTVIPTEKHLLSVYKIIMILFFSNFMLNNKKTLY